MRIRLIVALAAMCLTPALAQLGEAPEERLDIKKVREQRKRVEGGGIADDSVKGRILEHYDKAISALESEQAAKRSLARLEQERAQVDSTFKNLRSELNKSPPTPVLDLPDNPTFEYVEVELARARVRLDGTRTALRAAEQEKVEREKRRNDISKRLGKLDQEMETVTEQLRSPRAEMVPEMGDAVTASLRAARQFAEQEIQTLRAELVLLDKRSALIPLRVDLAQRRVSYDERTVALLEAAAADGRAREASSSLDRVTRLSQETSKALPPMKGTAGETVQLARQLWAEDGVLNQTAVVATQLTNARKHQADLDRIAELIWRQFDAKGRRSGRPQVWPKVPDSFPHTSDVLVEFSDVQRKVPEVQQELIRLEESRAGSNDLRLEVQQAIRSAAGKISPESGTAGGEFVIHTSGRAGSTYTGLRAVFQPAYRVGESPGGIHREAPADGGVPLRTDPLARQRTRSHAAEVDHSCGSSDMVSLRRKLERAVTSDRPRLRGGTGKASGVDCGGCATHQFPTKNDPAAGLAGREGKRSVVGIPAVDTRGSRADGGAGRSSSYGIVYTQQAAGSR